MRGTTIWQIRGISQATGILSHSCRYCMMPASCSCPYRLEWLYPHDHLISARSSSLLCPKYRRICQQSRSKRTARQLTNLPESATSRSPVHTHWESSSSCCQHWHLAWYPRSSQSRQKMSSRDRSHQNWLPGHWYCQHVPWWSLPTYLLQYWRPLFRCQLLLHRASSH